MLSQVSYSQKDRILYLVAIIRYPVLYFIYNLSQDFSINSNQYYTESITLHATRKWYQVASKTWDSKKHWMSRPFLYLVWE